MSPTRKRNARTLLAAGVAMVTLATTLTPAASAGATCQVWNATSGGASTADLQQMIDTATAGDVLEVQGICVGGFVIDKTLSIRSRLKAEPGVLDAERIAPVITATGPPGNRFTVRLVGLRLRNGRGEYGGGISADGVDLRISGVVIAHSVSSNGQGGGGIWALSGSTIVRNSVIRDNRSVVRPGGINSNIRAGGGIYSLAPLHVVNTRVTHNKAWKGGGIAASTLWVSGTSVIDANWAKRCGGGVYGDSGTVIMRGRAQVTGNTSESWGGGICQDTGKLVLRDRSSIRGNSTSISGPWRGEGGGVNCWSDCRILLTDHASIVQNVAASRGGGIFANHSWVGGEVRISMSGNARVAHNEAVQGAGVYLVQGNTLAMRQKTRIANNVARSDSSCRGACRPHGGGVFAARHLRRGIGDGLPHIVVSDAAAIDLNRPDNIYREPL